MELQERIREQLRLGHGLKIGGDKTLIRSAGRKEAQEAFDAPALKEHDDAAILADTDAALAKVAFDAMSEPEEPAKVPALSDDASEDEAAAAQEAQEAYAVKMVPVNAYAQASKKEAERKAFAVSQRELAAKIRKAHEPLGPTESLTHTPSADLCKDLCKFLSKHGGHSDSLVRAYIDSNPSATLMKIKNQDGYRALIVASDGTIVDWVKVTTKES